MAPDLRDLQTKQEKPDYLPAVILLAMVVLVAVFVMNTKPAAPPQAPQPYAPAAQPTPQPRPTVEQPPVQETPRPSQPLPTPSQPSAPPAPSYKPDLVLSALEAPEFPITLKSFPVTFRFENQGSGNAGPFKLSVEIRNKKDVLYENTFSFDGLGAGAANAYKFDFSGQYAGDYAVKAVIDPASSIEEGNEFNNAVTKVVRLYNKPDLVVSYLNLEPNPPAEMEEAHITLRVKNLSPIPAPKGAYVRLDLPNADTLYFVLRVPTVLQQNQEYEFPVLTVRFSGRYAQAWALVDSTEVIDEDNEKNNTAAIDVNPSIPDLEIDSVKVTGPSEITVTVANNSNAPLVNEEFRVFLKADGLLFGGVDNTSFLVTDGLGAGKAIQYKVRNVTPGRKLFKVFVVADPDAFVLESNENNNTVDVQLEFP